MTDTDQGTYISAAGLQALLDLRYAEGCRAGYAACLENELSRTPKYAKRVAEEAYPLPTVPSSGDADR